MLLLWLELLVSVSFVVELYSSAIVFTTVYCIELSERSPHDVTSTLCPNRKQIAIPILSCFSALLDHNFHNFREFFHYLV